MDFIISLLLYKNLIKNLNFNIIFIIVDRYLKIIKYIIYYKIVNFLEFIKLI
jgi:hypothetical protein